MHNCDVPPVSAPAPAATGPQLLLELGNLIVHSRDPPPPASAPLSASSSLPARSAATLLQAKLLAARSLTPELPSTSKETSEDLFRRSLRLSEAEGWDGLVAPGGAGCVVDAGAVGEAVSRAQRSLCLDAQLTSHVQALWSERVPICIDVFLASGCQLCAGAGSSAGVGAGEALLLERWTLSLCSKKSAERPPRLITSQWLLNAVRSQLHFSQISAWRAKLRGDADTAPDPQERQRRRSRETCNYKKLESNCDADELAAGGDTRDDKDGRKLNIVYQPHLGGVAKDFTRAPTAHSFPLADVAADIFLEVILESLPRMDDIPTLRCACVAPKRRASRDGGVNLACGVAVPHEELAARLGDLTLGPSQPCSLINSNIPCSSRKLSMFSTPQPDYRRVNTPEYQDLAGSVQLDHPYSTVQPSETVVRANYLLVDDRMHTPCSESGKHRCSCDDESDAGRLDERRLRELAKYKRRIRKESRMKRLSGSESSEPTTSIPILQAARFDRMRALGCYRTRGYIPQPLDAPQPIRRTATVGTQTEDSPPTCACGRPLELSCDACRRRLVRSEASYDLARASRRRERDDSTRDQQAMKKHKCDTECDAVRDVVSDDQVIKRPKLRRPFAIGAARRIDRVVSDRCDQRTDRSVQRAESIESTDRVVQRTDRPAHRTDSGERTDKPERHSDDIDELLLRDDDSVFAHMAPASPTPTPSTPPHRTSSTDEELVLCDYGTFDRYDDALSSPVPSDSSGSVWEQASSVRDSEEDRRVEGRPARGERVPSPREMEGFRWRLDSAASMVFHARTGLPLTSSPAPLRRGKSCFDYDSSITDISGIKSALFHPVSPPEGWWSPGSSPGSPAPPPASPPPVTPPRPATPRRRSREPRVKMAPSSGLLGSFEESALNGRLEPVATVHGFTAELGASGAFCPPHRRLPVTVFFYSLGGTNAPYLGHINLGPSGYRVPRSGTIQVSLLNPHGTLVKMFVVLYDLTDMPPNAKTFLRQKTLYLPCDVTRAPPNNQCHRWLRYLIHLRFLTSKSGKLYLHTDIRIIVSRKADLDTATAHAPIYNNPSPANHDTDRIISTNSGSDSCASTNHSADTRLSTNHVSSSTNSNSDSSAPSNQSKEADKDARNRTSDVHKSAFVAAAGSSRVNRVFGGGEDEEMSYNSSEGDILSVGNINRPESSTELSSESGSYGHSNKVENVSYELRSFTYAPGNPKYSPR